MKRRCDKCKVFWPLDYNRGSCLKCGSNHFVVSRSFNEEQQEREEKKTPAIKAEPGMYYQHEAGFCTVLGMLTNALNGTEMVHYVDHTGRQYVRPMDSFAEIIQEGVRSTARFRQVYAEDMTLHNSHHNVLWGGMKWKAPDGDIFIFDDIDVITIVNVADEKALMLMTIDGEKFYYLIPATVSEKEAKGIIWNWEKYLEER